MSTTQSDRSFATTTSRWEDQAAATALHDASTSPSKSSSRPVLDEDGKLSAAGAATSLKYARPQELPSFPSVGTSMSSAGAAASLAESRKKSFELWKPAPIPAANKAATLAKDYEMDPLWQAEASAAGSKAAVQAQRESTPVKIWRPSPTEYGQSAAEQALSRKSGTPTHSREVPAETRRKALLAATASFSGNRRRAESAPMKGDPSGEFTTGDPGFEAARVQNMAKNNVSRQMYGSKPPVAIEVEEQNRQAVLKASAIAMARKMYAIQQAHIEEAKTAKRNDGQRGAKTAHGRSLSDAGSATDDEPKVGQYYNLEEAARKLAQERLAKLHDEHAEYRQYYGAQTPPPRSRFSFRGTRPRATSDSRGDDDSDEEQSRKIRSQMSIFQSKLAAVDDKKRQADRDALLERARKNVDKSINAMDERVFQETGKMSPQQRELWEKTARDRAQRESDERMVNHGKVHIGGGKYMDQSEIDAIAKARLQPTLDEISEKAEAQRARDEEIRLAEEQRKREEEAEKTRIATVKAEERAGAQKEKNERKAKEAEEKRVRKEEATVAKTQADAEKEKTRLAVAEERSKQKAEAATEKERLRLEKEETRKNQPEKKGGRFSSLFGAGAATSAAGGVTASVPEITTTDADDDATDGEGALARADAADKEAYSKEDGLPAAQQVDGAESGLDADAAEEDDKDDADEDDDKAKDEAEDDDGVEENKFVSSMPGEEGLKEDKDEEEPTTESGIYSTTSPASPGSPTSPGKSDSKVRTWFKSRFRSGSYKKEEERPTISAPIPVTEDKPDVIEEEKEKVSQEDSMRDVAIAGRTSNAETDDMYGSTEAKQTPAHDTVTQEAEGETAPAERDPSPVSSLSESNYSKPEAAQDDSLRAGSVASSTDHPPRGRKGFRERILSKITSGKEQNQSYAAAPTTAPPDPPSVAYEDTVAVETKKDLTSEPTQTETTTGTEDNDEARDTFQEEKSSPTKIDTTGPTENGEATGAAGTGVEKTAHDLATISPKSSHERSKFKEEL